MTNSHDPNVRSKIRAAHGQLHSFFDSTREALGGDEAKMACGQLHNALETHFAQEEILYFPALWQLRPDLEPTLRGLIAFHAGFLERLDEIARMIDAGARTEAEAAFVELQRLFALHEAGEEEAMRSLD